MLQNENLIQLLKAGKREGFNELIRQYGHSVLAICYKFLLNREDAEDVSQEVFIEIYQSISHFRGDAKLSTWIHKIVISKCLEFIKKQKRKKRWLEIGKKLHIDEVAHWLIGGTMPDKVLIENEQLQEVLMALSILPDNQRVAFTLSKIEGYTNTEIAEIMNVSQYAVESLVYRAKKEMGEKLIKILKNTEGGNFDAKISEKNLLTS